VDRVSIWQALTVQRDNPFILYIAKISFSLSLSLFLSKFLQIFISSFESAHPRLDIIKTTEAANLINRRFPQLLSEKVMIQDSLTTSNFYPT